MFVGRQLRKYHLGVPMGDPLSVAKANGLCMVAEFKADRQQQLLHGDSVRNLSLHFMDDLFFRAAYVDEPSSPWSRQSALKMISTLQTCYPATLTLE